MIGLLLSACWLMAGCSVIDDDLSDCPADEQQYQMVYQLKLVTNMTTEISTQLDAVTETSVANALKEYLKNIFTDYAHDVDLSFYDTDGSLARLHHDTHIMDANQKSYTLTLPMRKYQHLAVANIADDEMVSLTGDEYCNTSELIQDESTKAAVSLKHISSHTTGVFTARQSMEVLEGVDQTFHVKLYMVNSAATLVLNPKEHPYKDIKVYTTGFASAFHINDSAYVYSDNPPLVEAKPVKNDSKLLCFCSVNFPSRDATKAATDQSLWKIKVYLTKMDGKVTETVLDIKEALKAGNLKIIKGELDDDGAVRPYDSKVGASVMLDWNEGGSYDPDL